MPDLSGYTLSDLMLFSPRVYYRLFELHNADVWPMQILTLIFGVVLLVLLARRHAQWSTLALAGLGMIWIWVGLSYLWMSYATINWAAVYLVPLFVLEGLLLIWIGIRNRQMSWSAGTSAAHISVVLLAFFAICIYPLIAGLMGRSWYSAEIFGIAPDPTAIATLALLIPIRSKIAWLAFTVALVWCLVSGLTLWTMNSDDFIILASCICAAIVVALLSRLAGRTYEQRAIREEKP